MAKAKSKLRLRERKFKVSELENAEIGRAGVSVDLYTNKGVLRLVMPEPLFREMTGLIARTTPHRDTKRPILMTKEAGNG